MMRLRFVRPHMGNYSIIVDNNDNEVVLRVPNHVLIRSPFTVFSLADIDRETRNIILSIDSMIKGMYGRSIMKKNFTFKIYFLKHTAQIFDERRKFFALVRVGLSGTTTIRAWNPKTYQNWNHIGYHVRVKDSGWHTFKSVSN